MKGQGIAKKSIIIAVLGLALFLVLSAQEQPQQQPTKAKTWQLPEYMKENLQWMIKDFNERFTKKVETYEKELRTRFEEFKDMPEDVVLDIEAGIFIERSDYLKLQEQLRRKMLEEQIKKEKKKNEKQIN